MFRAGVIGTGFGAQHVAWLSQLPHASVISLAYSTDRDRAERLAVEHGIPSVTGSAAELVLDPEVTLVAVVGPPATHEPLARRALELGKLVVVDKPLAGDLGTARRLAELGRAHPGRHGIVFQWRRNAAVAAARSAIGAGRIGRVLLADLSFHHDFLDGPRTACPWRHDPAVAGAGALADQAVHLFDLLPWLTGLRWAVDRSTALVAFPTRFTDAGREVPGGTDDLAATELREDGGPARARVLVSRVSRGLRRWEAVVVGTAGTVTVTADPDDGSARLAVRAAGHADERELGPDPMNPYAELLGGPDPGRLSGPSFEDGLAAQQLLDAATPAASSAVRAPAAAAAPR